MTRIKTKEELFDLYLDRVLPWIYKSKWDCKTYWFECEYFLVDSNSLFVVPKSANTFLENNTDDTISWESWTFQLEISSNYQKLLNWSMSCLLEEISSSKKKINNFFKERNIHCISTGLPPYIDSDFDKHKEYLNQENKYKIERDYWNSREERKYTLLLGNKTSFDITDSCANLALLNGIHINIKLESVEDFIKFHNVGLSLMPFFYGLSSNASFLNSPIIWKSDARLNIGMLSNNFTEGSTWIGIVPYIDDLKEYFDFLNSFKYDFDFCIDPDMEKNAFELKRESCWLFQQFKILDDESLLYEYRPLTMQVSSEWSVFLGSFTIFCILFYLETPRNMLLPLGSVESYMCEAADNGLIANIWFFNEEWKRSVLDIYNSIKQEVIDFAVNKNYITKDEGIEVLRFLDKKTGGSYDIQSEDSLKLYIEKSRK